MPPMPGVPRLLGLLLVVAALARMALVAWHDPVLGHADQGDMRRVTACVGLRADAPETARNAPTPYAPIARYVIGPPEEASCAYGSEVALAAVAVMAHRVASGEATFPLRWVGATKAILALGLLALGCALLWPFPRAFLLHGVTAFAILGDPITTLWLNTFYAEIPIFLGAYAMIAAVVAIGLRGEAGIGAMAMLVLGSLLLGLSKMQFFLLPLAIVVLALPVLVPAGRRAAAVAVAVGLLPCAALLAPASPQMIAANRFNTYLGALAAASPDPRAALQRVGLPARCEPFVGGTWFRLRGEDLAATCPEVRTLGMAAFVPLAIEEPGTVATAMARALAPGQNAFGSFGLVGGERYGRFEQAPAWARSAWEPLFMHLRARQFFVLVAFAAGVGVLSTFSYGVLAIRRPRGAAFVMALYLSVLALCFGYALTTSVLGDGLADIAKHLTLGSMALVAGMLAAIGWWLATWRADASRAARIATNAIAIVALVAAVPLVAAYRDLPLAFGVIDQPGDERPVAGQPAEVRGWAVDPYGVRSVEARIGAVRFAARDDLPYPEVERLYPNLPRAANSGFLVQVPAEAMTPAGADLRVVVTNHRGVETEVDRRRIR